MSVKQKTNVKPDKLSLRELKKMSKEFWHPKSLEQLAKEQGVKKTTLAELRGIGKDLWKTDDEYYDFIRSTMECRGRSKKAIDKHIAELKRSAKKSKR